MNFKNIWKDYQVLIVMIPTLVLIHWSWFNIKSSPIFNPRLARIHDGKIDFKSHDAAEEIGEKWPGSPAE